MEIKEILKRKKEIAIVILVILIMIVIAIISGNNETEIIPFQITNITITSNANANSNNSEPSKKWNLNIYQNNDIYIEFAGVQDSEKISKKNSRIKEIYVENFTNSQGPILGSSISMYKLSDDENKLFEFNDTYRFENKLNFEVVEKDASPYKKQVNKNNGQICFSVVNNNIKNIEISDEEVKFDGTLINIAQIDANEIVFTESFDIVIITEANNKYVAKVSLVLPCADITGGFGLNENVDVSNIKFEYIEE
ncbi:MAG: hypothetical protein E7311_03890 [Clostridiales bacterium]|nr:hypothetical protein [Clostridiales bacterium]